MCPDVSGMFLSIAAFSMHMFGTSRHQFLLPKINFQKQVLNPVTQNSIKS